jgi:peroxiredoxin (alkyl hydroperoxide reductase subunit C)
LAAVAAAYPCIRELDADAIAISTDSIYAHKVFAETSPNARKVMYPLLSDRNGNIAHAFGVLDKDKGAAYRASFIIDPGGRIRYYSVYPREVGRNVWEIIRTLQGIQYGEATGEGVPAGWEPGDPGIKRDFKKAGTI